MVLVNLFSCRFASFYRPAVKCHVLGVVRYLVFICFNLLNDSIQWFLLTLISFTSVPTPWSRSSLSHTHRSTSFFSTKPLSYLRQILWDPFHIYIIYTSDIIMVFTSSPTPCSSSSLWDGYRSVGFFRQTFVLVVEDSVRPIDYSVSDSRVVFTPVTTPSSSSSLSDTHRSMDFFRNQTFSLLVTDSARPFDDSVSDWRVLPVFRPVHTTSRLLSSSLSIGVPVPHVTQCMWGV